MVLPRAFTTFSRLGFVAACWMAAALGGWLSVPQALAADERHWPDREARGSSFEEFAGFGGAGAGGTEFPDTVFTVTDESDSLFSGSVSSAPVFDGWPPRSEPPPLDAMPVDDAFVLELWTAEVGPRPPWANARFPRVARAGTKIVEDYRNFYGREGLVCLSVALAAGGIMANTGFDETVQDAWQRSVAPSGMGRFFSGCKDLGEGKYALPIFGAAIATGILFEERPVGGVVGEWGARSLRIFVVGAPPMYTMQWATGASRPGESSAGSDWKPFTDDNGVSGHAFVAAIPFLAAADMCESPLLKGTLYVCSTLGAFSRMTDDMHYPSQAFLGWYFAWAGARAVDATELSFAGVELRMVPVLAGDRGGMGVEARW
jgi:hypothetical protein